MTRIKHAVTTCFAIGCFMVLSVPTIICAVIAWFIWGRG